MVPCPNEQPGEAVPENLLKRKSMDASSLFTVGRACPLVTPRPPLPLSPTSSAPMLIALARLLYMPGEGERQAVDFFYY